MPGIVGLVGAEDLGRVSAALKKISYIEAYEASVFPESPTLTLGCVGRPSQMDFATTPDQEHSRLSVLVYGTVFSQHPRPRRLPASQILDDYRTGGFRELRQNYDGSFVIVVVDHGKARVHVATDRVGRNAVRRGALDAAQLPRRVRAGAAELHAPVRSRGAGRRACGTG